MGQVKIKDKYFFKFLFYLFYLFPCKGGGRDTDCFKEFSGEMKIPNRTQNPQGESRVGERGGLRLRCSEGCARDS